MPYNFCHRQKFFIYDITASSIKWILMVTLTIGSQVLSFPFNVSFGLKKDLISQIKHHIFVWTAPSMDVL